MYFTIFGTDQTVEAFENADASIEYSYWLQSQKHYENIEKRLSQKRKAINEVSDYELVAVCELGMHQFALYFK